MRRCPTAGSLREVNPRAGASRSVVPDADARRVHWIVLGLLDWYDATARDLPWRWTRDPYRVLVSELMLQQTQVSRVLDAYDAFLARFPDLPELAGAPVSEVVSAWRGLGYNRRAVNLHRCAEVVVERHEGRIPDDLNALLALPGIGPYTARAVLAFAFEKDVAPVDTNVGRVLTRAVAGEPLASGQVQRVADAVVPPGRGHDWSQALMDLGATVCRARSPRCDECPIARSCHWRTTGGDDPVARSAVRPRPQARFSGSDRFHRGRLVDALRSGPVARQEVGAAAQLDDEDRCARIVSGLVRDGLAVWEAGRLQLP